MRVFLAVALGGAAGSLARYSLDRVGRASQLCRVPVEHGRDERLRLSAGGASVIAALRRPASHACVAACRPRDGGSSGATQRFRLSPRKHWVWSRRGDSMYRAAYAFGSLTTGVLAVLAGMRIGESL